MSLRRWNRPIKSLAAKGKPGTMMRHISVRTAPWGGKYEWHPRKGFRRWVSSKSDAKDAKYA